MMLGRTAVEDHKILKTVLEGLGMLFIYSEQREKRFPLCFYGNKTPPLLLNLIWIELGRLLIYVLFSQLLTLRGWTLANTYSG